MVVCPQCLKYMHIPKSLQNLIDSFERLPGIGPKTAQRLGFYMMNFPQDELVRFGENIATLKLKLTYCSKCKNISENTECKICSDPLRDAYIIAVVSNPLDVVSIEKTNYKGMYHVLHGLINPLSGIGPEELFIKDLIERIEQLKISMGPMDRSTIEIILATSTSMEGESTALYISRLIKENFDNETVKVTRIARGLPVGGDVEYADNITLGRALDGRLSF